jgi:hypothetical protein
MLTLSRRVVVMDFGIAQHQNEIRAETIGGTPGYMSPEQAAGLPLDARADVFSAAVVPAEMASSPGGGIGDAERCGRSFEKIRRSGRAVERRAPAGVGPFAGGSVSVRRRAGARARTPTSREWSHRGEPLSRPSAVHTGGRAFLLRPRTGSGVAASAVATSTPESCDWTFRRRQEFFPQSRPAPGASPRMVGARLHTRRQTLHRVGPGPGSGVSGLHIVTVLEPGVTFEAANAEIAGLSAALPAAAPPDDIARVEVRPFTDVGGQANLAFSALVFVLVMA